MDGETNARFFAFFPIQYASSLLLCSVYLMRLGLYVLEICVRVCVWCGCEFEYMCVCVNVCAKESDASCNRPLCTKTDLYYRHFIDDGFFH